MSNLLIGSAVLAGGVALGMREDVRKSVTKAAGVTSHALQAGKERFIQTEADRIEATTVTNLPRQASQ